MALPTGHASDDAVEGQSGKVAQLKAGACVHRRDGGGHSESVDCSGQIGDDALFCIAGVYLDEIGGGSIGKVAAGNVVVHVGLDSKLLIGEGVVFLPEHKPEHEEHAAKEHDGEQTKQYETQEVDSRLHST